MRRSLSALILVLCFGQLCCSRASAQVSVADDCAFMHYHSHRPEALGFEPPEADTLVYKIADAVGYKEEVVTVLPCEEEPKVESDYFVKGQVREVPPGAYIFYKPIWMREVIGPNISNRSSRDFQLAVIVFGHELGHLKDQHFTTNAGWPRLRKETDADRFAGCAAAVMHVPWESVADLLGRLREAYDAAYPSRDHAVAAASVGYKQCSGKSEVADPDRRYQVALEQAILSNRRERVQTVVASGASPDSLLSDNRPAVAYAWINGDREAFEALIEAGAKIPSGPLFDDLVFELVRDADTSPAVLRAVIKAGAPVKSGPLDQQPACIAVRAEFRQILRDRGARCG